MSREDIRVNIPNLISLGRLLCVPVTVWLVLNGNLLAAFWLFVTACISDGADGFIAKRFNCETVLGGYLDPIADKALLVSVYLTLGNEGYLAAWLVILVVFRDALIVCGAYLFQLLYQRLTIHPLVISKINTTFQFILAAAILGMKGYDIDDGLIIDLLSYIVAATTFLSGSAYVVIWSRRAAAMEPGK